MQVDDIDPIFLARYFSGEGSEADVQAVRRWIAADPARAVFVDRMWEVWRIGGEVQPIWDVEGALAAVRARGDRGVVPMPAPPSEPARLRLLRSASRRWRPMALRLAAAVAVAVGVRLAWHAYTNSSSSATSGVDFRTFATANAEQSVITLADGSRIVLGPASTLRVPERFGPHARRVELDGEAYFAVAHDTLRPFTVTSGIGVVRVLGTKFDVRARPETPGVTVVVAEGHVALARRGVSGAAASAPVVLGAGDLGRVVPGDAPRATHGVDVRRYLAWTDGRLAFVDAPVPAVLAELSRWYDVEFRIDDPALAARHLTTTVQGETVPQILDLLATSLDVNWTEIGRTVTLSRKRR